MKAVFVYEYYIRGETYSQFEDIDSGLQGCGWLDLVIRHGCDDMNVRTV